MNTVFSIFFHAPLLGFHGRVDGGRVGADVVEDQQHIVLLQIVVIHDGAAVVLAPLQRQILLRLVEHGQPGFHAGVDVAQPARPEEHFAHGQRGMSAAAVYVDEPVVLNRLGHQLSGRPDVFVLLAFDLVQQFRDQGQVAVGMIAHKVLLYSISSFR